MIKKQRELKQKLEKELDKWPAIEYQIQQSIPHPKIILVLDDRIKEYGIPRKYSDRHSVQNCLHQLRKVLSDLNTNRG